MSFRELQTWPMSEFTKRLPGFVAKSRAAISEYLQGEGKVEFSPEEGGWHSFIILRFVV